MIVVINFPKKKKKELRLDDFLRKAAFPFLTTEVRNFFSILRPLFELVSFSAQYLPWE